MIEDKVFKEMAVAIKAAHKSRVQNPIAFKLKTEKGFDIKKEKNKSIASAKARARYNAAGSQLRILNDAKKELARKARMSDPRHAGMVDAVVKKAMEEIDKKVLDQSSLLPVSRPQNQHKPTPVHAPLITKQRQWYSTHNAIHNAGSNKGYGSPQYHSAAAPTDGRSMSPNNFGKKNKVPEYY